MKKEHILILLLLVCIFEIIGEVIAVLFEIPYLILIFKPLLMPLLAYWYLKNSKKPIKVLLYALLFSWFGDVFLMFLFVNQNFFLAGLVAFLITHILYTVVFFKYIDTSKNSILRKRPHLVLPFVLYGLSLFAYLIKSAHPDFLPIKIPVFVYSSIIMIMVIAAIARYERATQKSFSLVLVGALLFMFSDTVIALSNFTPLFGNYLYVAKILIIAMYVSGQYFIVKGLLADEKEEILF